MAPHIHDTGLKRSHFYYYHFEQHSTHHGKVIFSYITIVLNISQKIDYISFLDGTEFYRGHKLSYHKIRAQNPTRSNFWNKSCSINQIIETIFWYPSSNFIIIHNSFTGSSRLVGPSLTDSTILSVLRLDAQHFFFCAKLYHGKHTWGPRQRTFLHILSSILKQVKNKMVRIVYPFVKSLMCEELFVPNIQLPLNQGKLNVPKMNRNASIVLHSSLMSKIYFTINSNWKVQNNEPHFSNIHDCFITVADVEYSQVTTLGWNLLVQAFGSLPSDPLQLEPIYF